MSKITVTTKTQEQIDADFAEAFKGINPIVPDRALTQVDRLKPYRKQIMKQRQRGLNWKQIAAGMAHPRVNETVSAALLRRLFGKPRKKPAKAVRFVPADDRVILDPATGEPLPPPPPAPMTAEEHKRFDPLFEGLIPPIVKTAMKRADARNYAARAVERFRPADAARFQQLLSIELDALDETNCARYNVPPDSIAHWKRRWNKST